VRKWVPAPADVPRLRCATRHRRRNRCNYTRPAPNALIGARRPPGSRARRPTRIRRGIGQACATMPCGRTGQVVRTAEPGSFGELLRRHRTAAKLTHAELAERAGLSARRVRDLARGLRGCPDDETTRRLADALGLNDHDRAALRLAGAH